MKILIISSYFPPQNSIASLRPYSWAKYWSKIGHDVTVLTTNKTFHENDLKLDVSMFKIISVPLWVPLKNAYQKEKKYIVNSNNLRLRLNIKQKALKIVKSYYDRFIEKTGCFYTCRFPDWHDIWARKAYKYVNNNNWDLVVSTGWPYSVHKIAYKLKKNNQAKKWVLDWRDLWTKNHLFPGLKIFNPIERFLENKFHKTANYITTVSKGLAETLQIMTKTPVVVIFNGYDKEDFQNILLKTRICNKELVIVYTGTIYKDYRDPEPLFKAISELLNEGSIGERDIKLIFAGPKQTDVMYLAQKYNVLNVYEYKGFLPREEALELQYNADILLFLEYQSEQTKGVLTGKLFEYLYISKEIWAIGLNNDSEVGSLIEKSNSGICLGKDIGRIKEEIIKKIQEKKQNKQKLTNKNQELLEIYDREYQAKKMLELVMDLH